jgi:class 3 adenylate cyclase/tetratricopeptide (TPR) repeat protein
MPSERVQRQIDRLLDEAEWAIAESDWSLVRARSQQVLALAPDNADAHAYLAAADRGRATSDSAAPSSAEPFMIPLAAARFAAPVTYTPHHLAERIRTGRRALEGERKQVTALFCDVVNFTTLAEQLGPEATHDLLGRFFDLALGEVHRYEGTVNKFLGDGFLALFGVPLTHEDHARRAVLAALGIQRAVVEHAGDLLRSTKLDTTGDPDAADSQTGAAPDMDHDPLEVRIGLNTGWVVVGTIGDNLEMDYTAIGDTVNVAARLQALAEPGAILASEATTRLVSGYVRSEALGPMDLKGRAEPVMVHCVVGVGPRRSPLDGIAERGLSPFVGRARELAMLHELLEQAEAGHGQAVGLVGEPGMGKSRLLLEFRRSLAGRRVTYLEGRCLSYGSATPYLPLLDIVRANCGILDMDDAETITAKVMAAVREVDLEPKESASYLLHLLGVREATEQLALLSPEAIKARTFEFLRQMSLKGSHKRPILFVIEDLHWLDKTSEEFCASLVEAIAGARILLLYTYRPGYRPPWSERSYVTQIALRRLSSEDSLRVVQATLATEQVPEQLAGVILDKAEGNPFFLEELARAVGAHGDRPTEMPVPDTVQGVLMARIDRLPAGPRRVLQTASVLGREFSLRLLNAIWEGEETVDSHLLQLQQQEFIHQKASGNEPVCVFTHALTQDAAYESLLVSHRKILHAAAAGALESMYVDRLDEVYELLGYHFARTDEAAKAVYYLAAFAERAGGDYAHAEAVSALQQALVHAERLPAGERDTAVAKLVVAMANSLYFLGRFAEALDLLLRHQARVEHAGDPGLVGPYFFWLGHTYSYLADRDQAVAWGERARAEAIRAGDDATLRKANYLLARAHFWLSEFGRALAYANDAVAPPCAPEDRWWLGQSYWQQALIYAFTGDLKPCVAAVVQLQSISEALADPRLESYAAWTASLYHAFSGDGAQAVEAATRSIAVAPDPLNIAVARGFLGHAHLVNGDPARAVIALEHAVADLNRFRFRGLEGWLAGVLADAYRVAGHTEKAQELASYGAETGAATWRFGLGWAQRALGHAARASGAMAEAESQYVAALATFTAIGARLEAARTSLALAELAAAVENRGAAAMHLTEAAKLLRELNVPYWEQQTVRIAVGYGITG